MPTASIDDTTMDNNKHAVAVREHGRHRLGLGPSPSRRPGTTAGVILEDNNDAGSHPWEGRMEEEGRRRGQRRQRGAAIGGGEERSIERGMERGGDLGSGQSYPKSSSHPPN